MALKPLNAAERRSQFAKFVLLFLLAMVPVVIFMVLLDKTNKQRYESVRKERDELKREAKHDAQHKELVDAVINEAKGLRTDVFQLQPSLAQYIESEKKDSQLENDLLELQEAIEKLKKDGGGATGDDELIAIAQDFNMSVQKLLEIYDSGFEKVSEARASATKCNDDYKTLDAALTACLTENGNLKFSRGN